MDKILLENGLNYLVVLDCIYNEKKYLYIINENDSNDIKIVEWIDNSKIKVISDSELLKDLINKMVLEADKLYD